MLDKQELAKVLDEFKKIEVKNVTDKILLVILDEQRYFLAIIAKRLWQCLDMPKGVFFHVHKNGSIPDIFVRSLDVLQDKYISTGRVSDYVNAKKVLAQICTFQSYKFVKVYIDEQWYRRLSTSQKKAGLRPPSYFYTKKYYQNNRERINERRRETYRLGLSFDAKRWAEKQMAKGKPWM
jgi:hypothetical protein